KVMEALLQFVRSGVILANIGISLQGLVIGFSLSLIMGLIVGALMGRYRYVEKALDVYVHALFICPSIIFAPIFFAIFGLSDAAKVFAIAMVVLIIGLISNWLIQTLDNRLTRWAD